MTCVNEEIMTNRRLAAFLAQEVFKHGEGRGAPTQRLKLMGGRYPDAETDLGGLNRECLINILTEALEQVFPRQ